MKENIIDVLIMFLICLIGGIISIYVPDNWKYVTGFIVASILDVVMDIIHESKG